MINIELKKFLILADKYKKTAFNTIFDKLLYRKKPTIYPRLINLFITEKCNFSCPMCHVKKSRIDYQKKDIGDLNLDLLKPLISESAKHGSSFQIVGGEPFLNAEIFDIIKFLDKNKLPKGLTTNGLLLEEFAKDVIKSGLDFLSISLDGPDEETQYKRGYVKNSFNKIIRGIKKVIALRKGKILPNIRIATVVSPINIYNFDKILDIVSELGVEQWSLSHYFYYYDKIKEAQDNFNKIYNLGSDIWGDYNGSNKKFYNQEQRDIIKDKYKKIFRIIDDRNNKTRITIQKDLDIEKYYTGYMPKKGSVCTSPYNQVFIRGNGDIEMCQGYILGNIKNDNLKNVWFNDKAKHFRKIFNEVGLTPACFRCCAVSKFIF